MTTSLLFGLLWPFSFVSAFLISLIKLVFWLKFSTDRGGQRTWRVRTTGSSSVSQGQWSCSLLTTFPPVLEALAMPTEMLQCMPGIDSVVGPVTVMTVHRFLLHFLTCISWVRAEWEWGLSWHISGFPRPSKCEWHVQLCPFLFIYFFFCPFLTEGLWDFSKSPDNLDSTSSCRKHWQYPQPTLPGCVKTRLLTDA